MEVIPSQAPDAMQGPASIDCDVVGEDSSELVMMLDPGMVAVEEESADDTACSTVMGDVCTGGLPSPTLITSISEQA